MNEEQGGEAAVRGLLVAFVFVASFGVAVAWWLLCQPLAWWLLS